MPTQKNFIENEQDDKYALYKTLHSTAKFPSTWLRKVFLNMRTHYKQYCYMLFRKIMLHQITSCS